MFWFYNKTINSNMMLDGAWILKLSSIMLRNRKEDNFNFFFQSMDELLHLKKCYDKALFT